MKKFKDLFEAPGDLKKGDPSVNYSLQQGRTEPDDEQATKYKPRSKGEQEFANQHMIDKRDYYAVPGQDHVFNGSIKGNPDDHVGGKKHAGGETTPIKQGSSEVKPSGVAFKEPKLHGRPGEKNPVKQGSSTVREEVELTESVVDTIKDISKNKKSQDVKFKNGRSLKVDAKTADMLLKVHGALKPANAKKFRDSLEKGPESFMKMLDFADSVSG